VSTSATFQCCVDRGTDSTWNFCLIRFFGQTRYASFQRQLNIYGFSRFSQGQDKGAYYNLCFVRGHRDLVRDMKRIKVKGSKVRKAPSPDEDEFNFYDVAWQNHFEATVPAAVAQKPSTLSSMLMQQESNRPVSPASGPTSAAVDPSTFNLLMLLAANNQTVPMVPLAPCSIPNTAALEVPVPSPAGATVAPATTTKNYDANISTVSDDSSVGSVDSLSILDELMPELGLDDPLGAESSDLYAPIAVDFFQPTPIQDLVQMTLVDPTRNIYSL